MRPGRHRSALAGEWATPSFCNCAYKMGYSGTAILVKKRPLNVAPHIGIVEHDKEGRVLTAELDDFFVVNVYVPNSKRDLTRLAYRKRWATVFLRYLKNLEKKKPVMFCGDLNVAHTEHLILANLCRSNIHNHGFTKEERAGFDKVIEAGFGRYCSVNSENPAAHYSWWSLMGGARARGNIGWRLDYFLISASLRPRLKKASHPQRNRRLRSLPGWD